MGGQWPPVLLSSLGVILCGMGIESSLRHGNPTQQGIPSGPEIAALHFISPAMTYVKRLTKDSAD